MRHTFPEQLDGSQQVPGPRILHFFNCGLDQWLEKYRVLGAFPDHWLGNQAEKIPLPFHLESRDVLGAQAHEAALELYQRVVVFDDPREVEQLSEAGLLERITSASQFIQSVQAQTSKAE